MSTLHIRTTHVPQAWVFPSFGRLVSFIGGAFEVFAEAQDMARAANKRYPFFAE